MIANECLNFVNNIRKKCASFIMFTFPIVDALKYLLFLLINQNEQLKFVFLSKCFYNLLISGLFAMFFLFGRVNY